MYVPVVWQELHLRAPLQAFGALVEIVGSLRERERFSNRLAGPRLGDANVVECVLGLVSGEHRLPDRDGPGDGDGTGPAQTGPAETSPAQNGQAFSSHQDLPWPIFQYRNRVLEHL